MLIAAPERWDEACFAIPAVRAMMHSGMKTGVLCREEQRAIWETLPGLVVVAFSETARAKILASRLAGHWEASIAWEPGIAAEACARAKIPRRVGPAGKPLGKFLTHPVAGSSKSASQEHRVRHYLNLIEALGLDPDRPEFFAPADLGIMPEAGTILLCPDSDFGRSYEWPLDRWLETARALQASERVITIAALANGAGLGHALAAGLTGEVPLFEASPLANVLPLLAVHQVVLAADGSLPHLAAYVGATCLTLFGPNDPQWKRPLGRRHATVSRYAECAPCFLAKCPLDGRCQQELEIPQVWSALRQTLDLTDAITP